MPTACEMRMNSLLSGSAGELADMYGGQAAVRERTGAAVHEEGAFPEKLGGHAGQLLAGCSMAGGGATGVLCYFLDVLHGVGRVCVRGEEGGEWRDGFNGGRERGDSGGEVWEYRELRVAEHGARTGRRPDCPCGEGASTHWALGGR